MCAPNQAGEEQCDWRASVWMAVARIFASYGSIHAKSVKVRPKKGLGIGIFCRDVRGDMSLIGVAWLTEGDV